MIKIYIKTQRDIFITATGCVSIVSYIWENIMIRIFLVVLLFCHLTVVGDYAIADDAFKQQRQQMVALIEKDVRETSNYIDMTALSSDVMDAMRSVRRHEFVPERQKRYAYQNRPLAIGHGQTISQPYIVALMTELMNVSSTSRILEVGTGSGYQAAILGKLVNQVYTIEIIEPLGLRAKKTLKRLNYSNIKFQIGDGYYGWIEQAPFDAIIVTAASSHVPPPLLKQLKPGGRLIIPVGSKFLTQQLLLIVKDNGGRVKTRQILPVRFVPLTGEH